MKIENKDYYSVKEIADMVGLSTVAVFHDIQKGRLKPESYKIDGSYIFSKFALALYLKYRADLRQNRKEILLKKQAKIEKQLQQSNS